MLVEIAGPKWRIRIRHELEANFQTKGYTPSVRGMHPWEIENHF